MASFRIKINHDPNSESVFEVINGSIGWPEVCIILLVTIAFIFIACLMERKSFLVKAEEDYRKMIDAALNNSLTLGMENYYLQILNRCANRDSTPQFYDKNPTDKEQYFI